MMSAKEAAAATLATLHKELVGTIPSMVRKACSEMQFQTQFVTSPLISVEAIEAIVGKDYAIKRVCDGNIVVFTLSWVPTLEEATAMLVPATVPALDAIQQLSVKSTNSEYDSFLAKISHWEYTDSLSKALTVEVLQKRLGPAYKVAQVAEYADDTHLVHVSWHLTPEQAEAHLGSSKK